MKTINFQYATAKDWYNDYNKGTSLTFPKWVDDFSTFNISISIS